MNAFEKFIHFLEPTMTRPTNYGWFHLMFVGIIVLGTVLLCVFFKNCNDKTFRRIMLIGWCTMAVLELYKQLVFSFECDDSGMAVWDFLWYSFPYQLCSTPLFVLPLIAALKDNRIREALCAYMSFFSLFGGLAVFFYPNDVFVETIGINIQTMVHHGLQIVLGIFCTVYYRRRFDIKHYVKSIPVYAVLLLVAIIMNEVGYYALTSHGLDDTFNMFYISRHFDCTLPVLSGIYKAVPYIAFILIYILGFAIVAFILFLLQRLVICLTRRKKCSTKADTRS